MRETLHFIIGIATLVCITGAIWNGTAYRDVHQIKKKAPKYLESFEYRIVGYEGFQGGMIHGGGVWYQVEDSDGYLYTLCVREWRGELHLYDITCLNAVKVRQ